MKRISTFVMLLCIVVLSANAQLLWKVSGKNLPKASYVLGTHHWHLCLYWTVLQELSKR